MTLKEFKDIIAQLKAAFDFENDMFELSKKYVNNQVLIDYIPTSSTYLVDTVCDLLSREFNLPKNDDLFIWWCTETDFGKNFKIGDIEETTLEEGHKFKYPNLTTVEGLYEYAVFLGET